MIIPRDITPHLLNLSSQYPITAILGPRQSGKTTLAKSSFPEYQYVNLESLDLRRAAQEDPRSFLNSYQGGPGVIIDEIQHVPELFSYLQVTVDLNRRPGFFIITGSQNFLLHAKITQSLAGRVALLTLLPLTVSELKKTNKSNLNLENQLFKGSYPSIYAHQIDPQSWLHNYIDTYVEKDVRQLLQISNTSAFQRFIQLCAARVGNLINYSALARDCDISPNTAKAWLSILETSYIIRLLTPYHQSFNKRLIKAPKLYFYDTGLVCALLRIQSPEELYLHPMRGAIFECLIVSEIQKELYNRNNRSQLHFWRDVQGHEVDIIIEKGFQQTVPVEIKASRTAQDALFKGLMQWQIISNYSANSSYIIYGGDEHITRTAGQFLAWHQIDKLLATILSNSTGLDFMLT